MNFYFYTRFYSPDLKRIQSEGTKKAVHGLASGFANCGVSTTILCEGDDDGEFEMPEGYKIRRFFNSYSSKKLTFRIAPGLKKFIQQNLTRNDLVILSGIFQPNIYALSQFLKRHDIPYSVIPHDPYSPAIFAKNSHFKWLYWYLLERQLLTQAKVVQLLDSRHAEFLHRLGVATPTIAVPNGFSPTDVQPEDSLTWNINHVPKLIFLGRMDAYNKGLDLLLEAFAQLVKTVDAKLTLQGVDKGDRKTLEESATQLSLTSRTAFLEPDYATAAPLIIKNHDIFCLPSRFEGFGLSALEAMLAGRVLLVSEVAGIAPHVQASGCGVVVTPEVSAIQSGLMELLQRRSEWREMGLRGRQYALEHLDWSKIASVALEQYLHLL